MWFLLLSGCANLQPAEAPLYRWTDVHSFGVTAIGFSPDGAMLASGGHCGVIAVWNVATRARIANANGHGEPARALQWRDGALLSADRNGLARFSPDGRCLASASDDETIASAAPPLQ